MSTYNQRKTAEAVGELSKLAKNADRVATLCAHRWAVIDMVSHEIDDIARVYAQVLYAYEGESTMMRSLRENRNADNYPILKNTVIGAAWKWAMEYFDIDANEAERTVKFLMDMLDDKGETE